MREIAEEYDRTEIAALRDADNLLHWVFEKKSHDRIVIELFLRGFLRSRPFLKR